MIQRSVVDPSVLSGVQVLSEKKRVVWPDALATISVVESALYSEFCE